VRDKLHEIEVVSLRDVSLEEAERLIGEYLDEHPGGTDDDRLRVCRLQMIPLRGFQVFFSVILMYAPSFLTS